MTVVHAVVLAAGVGRRFGADKRLVPLEGRPLLAHVLAVLRAAPDVAAVHVALRAGDTALALLRNARPVAVPDADEGMAASVRAGVAAAAAAGADAVLLCLADQPRLNAAVIAALAAAWRAGAECARPVYHDAPDAPGHPLLLDRRHFALAARCTGDRGLDPVLAAAGLVPVRVPVPGRLDDIDTPDDLARA